MPFKQKSRRRGRWIHFWHRCLSNAEHVTNRLICHDWPGITPLVTTCWLMGAQPLVTVLGTHPSLYSASCLLGWGSLTKGEGREKTAHELILTTNLPQQLPIVGLCQESNFVISTFWFSAPKTALCGNSYPSALPSNPGDLHKHPPPVTVSQHQHPHTQRPWEPQMGSEGSPKQRYVNYVIE